MDEKTIPVINITVGQAKQVFWDKVKEPENQKRLILVIVSIALLLDNMLYMVIVPIIPDYLNYIGAWDDDDDPVTTTRAPVPRNSSLPAPPTTYKTMHHPGQESATGLLFASKAIVQLMVNPFSGALIDKIGYETPMMVGLTIMFLSTSLFACGRSYGLLFFARSLQGAGSAFADTSGLAMIADRYTEENERSKALGIALAFISFGCLVAPPFGGALYQFAGKEVPFLILALVCLIDGAMLLLVMRPMKDQIRIAQENNQETIPIWKLLMDPYIACCAGALTMSNVALAFLEPTISTWMEDNLTRENWKIGMVWLPAFFPHVFGVILTVKLAKQYPRKQWLMAAIGLSLEGFSCFIIPFSSSYQMLMIPICIICFGIALIDTALLPTLGYIVDVRYVSVYGSIYAIADISYSMAYAVGPIIAGGIVELIGFTALNFMIAISNLAYAPLLGYLRNIYDFKPFENEANILMGDPPNKEYQTYTMHNQQPLDGDYKNHLEMGRDEYSAMGVQETNIDQEYSYQNSGAGQYQQQDQQYQQYQPGYQDQGGVYQEQGNVYQQQQQPQAQQRHLPQQPANPFRQSAAAQQQPQPPVSNPFKQGF